MDDVCTEKVLFVKGSACNKENHIWLWHHRLGHSSFGYLKHLIQSLFSGCQTSDFKCDTCIFSKSHRATYPLSANNTYVPFMLVHIDVWGPSLVSTHSSY